MRLSIQIEFDKILDLETKKNLVHVGRSPSNDLVIEHDSVSRKHCLIECQKGIFFITDIGSSNGTFIDGVRLEVNTKNPYVSSQQLVLGRLDCVLTQSDDSSAPEEKVLSSRHSNTGNYTATLRISRLDLNPPAMAEIQKKKVVPTVRNPVTDKPVKNKKKKTYWAKSLLVLILMIATIALAWILAPE